MKTVGKFEVLSNTSVVEDDRWLDFEHPDGGYRARVRNITRVDFFTPFRLEVHVYFEAESLDRITEAAEDKLARFLNVLALATEGQFKRHRRKVVVQIGAHGYMSDYIFSTDAMENEDPEPLLHARVAKLVHRIGQAGVGVKTHRALRWLRLGINSRVGDDQFQSFWFAMELLAGSKKSNEKIHDACPQCNQPLFCEQCQANPIHRPYPKQAIKALIQAAMPAYDDKQIEVLAGARNALAHGTTLREYEATHPAPEGDPHLVDKLYAVVRNALLLEFPEDVQGTLHSERDSTSVVSMTATMVAHIQTVVPQDENGDLDLSFPGLTIETTMNTAPQSAVPVGVFVNLTQFNQLKQIADDDGSDNVDFVRRLFRQVGQHPDGRIVLMVLSSDLPRLKQAVEGNEQSAWQLLIRDALANTPQGEAVPQPLI